MSKIVDEVSSALSPVIIELGYEIVEVEFKKIYGQDNLTVYIFSENGVSLDDCEKVHRAIDPVLDELDPTSGQAYVLNVSSPGLDRPIVTDRDFERAKGTKVEVGLYKKRDGKKKFAGTLLGRNNGIIEISSDKDTIIKFNVDEVAVVKPVIEF